MSSLEYEKLQEIIADVLNVDRAEVKMDTRFADDCVPTHWTSFRLSWHWRKPSILKLPMRMQRRSYQWGTQWKRSSRQSDRKNRTKEGCLWKLLSVRQSFDVMKWSV